MCYDRGSDQTTHVIFIILWKRGEPVKIKLIMGFILTVLVTSFFVAGYLGMWAIAITLMVIGYLLVFLYYLAKKFQTGGIRQPRPKNKRR